MCRYVCLFEKLFAIFIFCEVGKVILGMGYWQYFTIFELFVILALGHYWFKIVHFKWLAMTSSILTLEIALSNTDISSNLTRFIPECFIGFLYSTFICIKMMLRVVFANMIKYVVEVIPFLICSGAFYFWLDRCLVLCKWKFDLLWARLLLNCTNFLFNFAWFLDCRISLLILVFEHKELFCWLSLV